MGLSRRAVRLRAAGMLRRVEERRRPPGASAVDFLADVLADDQPSRRLVEAAHALVDALEGVITPAEARHFHEALASKVALVQVTAAPAPEAPAPNPDPDGPIARLHAKRDRLEELLTKGRLTRTEATEANSLVSNLEVHSVIDAAESDALLARIHKAATHGDASSSVAAAP